MCVSPCACSTFVLSNTEMGLRCNLADRYTVDWCAQMSYPLGSYSWRGQPCGQEECWSRHRWPVSGAGPGTGPAPGPEEMGAWLGTQTHSLHLSSTPPRGLLLSHWPWTYHLGPSVSGINREANHGVKNQQVNTWKCPIMYNISNGDLLEWTTSIVLKCIIMKAKRLN